MVSPRRQFVLWLGMLHFKTNKQLNMLSRAGRPNQLSTKLRIKLLATILSRTKFQFAPLSRYVNFILEKISALFENRSDSFCFLI